MFDCWTLELTVRSQRMLSDVLWPINLAMWSKQEILNELKRRAREVGVRQYLLHQPGCGTMTVQEICIWLNHSRTADEEAT